MEQWLKNNANLLFFRLNHNSKTKEEILTDLKEKYASIIVSQESASRPHFHILIVHGDSNTKNAQQNLKNFLKQKFTVKGNEDYAITETRKGTLSRLGAYVVKEGNFVQNGFSPELIEEFKALSYKKYTKNEFQEKLNSINDKYILSDLGDIRDYIRAYVELKVAFNQNLNVNTIVNYINLIYARKHGCDEISHKIYSKFNSL